MLEVRDKVKEETTRRKTDSHILYCNILLIFTFGFKWRDFVDKYLGKRLGNSCRV